MVPSAKRSRRTENLARDERGQTTAEYALLAFWTIAAVVIAMQQLWQAILNNYQDIVSIICLPIP